MKKLHYAKGLSVLLLIALILGSSVMPVSAHTQMAPILRSVTAGGTISVPYIRLDYSAVPDAVGYDIFRSYSPSGPFVQLNPKTRVTTNRYYDYNIVPGVIYYYAVRAYHFHLLIPQRSVMSNVRGTRFIRVSSVSAAPAVARVGIGMNLAYQISPSNATDRRMIVTSSNTAVATVRLSNGIIRVTPISPGQTTIKLYTRDGGKTCTSNLTVLPALNSGEVFIKQATNYTCTLASAVMLLRRREIVKLNPKWAAVTETSVRPTAWITNVGLKNNFTYSGNVMTCKLLSGTAAVKKQILIQMLATRPEGIVIYDGSKPHAVLLTRYNAANGTFYIADPAGSIRGETILANATTRGTGQDGKLANLSKIWFLAP